MAFLESIRGEWQNYSLTTISLVLYWLVLAWLVLFEKEKIKNHMFIYSILVPLMLVALETVGILFLGGRSLGKIFLLLPIGILIPYGGVRITENLLKEKKKWLVILLYAIIIQSGISLRYEAAPLLGGMNIYKVSPDVVKYVRYVNKWAKVEEPYLLAPDEIASQIQEYDVDIRVAYGPGYDYYEGNLEQLMRQMDEYQCNCFMVPLEYDDEEYVKSKGYRLVVTDEGYALYARK